MQDSRIEQIEPSGEEKISSGELDYTITNERIEAVEAGFGMGLSTHPTRILAVGGSGDIPFALLQYAEVDVVDINPAQVAFILQRAEQLKSGDYSGFLNPDVRGKNDGDEQVYAYSKSKRDKYFLTVRRLDRIRASLDRLKVRPAADIREVLKEDRKYSGIYLSNVLGLVGIESKVREDLDHAERRLQDYDGLLYIANGTQIESVIQRNQATTGLKLPKLGLDRNLTIAARHFGGSLGGLPAVYRKIPNATARL